jgi:hypothetical protein
LRIDVTSVGLIVTQAARNEVRRHVLLALSRFGREIREVTAHLTESSNPLGGADPHCCLEARLHSGQVLCAEAMGDGVEAAAGRSAAHLALHVSAALDTDPARPRPARS